MPEKVYTLYFDKQSETLRISLSNDNWFRCAMRNHQESEIVKYNNCYYVSCVRKNLVSFAREMKQKWIEETEDKLEKLRNIKI